MGQEPSAGGTALAGRQDPEHLRRQIEATRHELGQTVAVTVATLSEKAM